MAYPYKSTGPKKGKSKGKSRGRGKVLAAKAAKPAKSEKPKAKSLEDRVAALEHAALQNGWHLPDVLA